MLKLQWLQINKFRAVKPGTRLVFNPTFNVLLGQNGTGKTTLLNLVAAVVSSDFTALRDEEFELEYELAHEAGRIVASVRNARAVQAVSPSLGTLHFDVMRTSEGLNAPVLSAEVRMILRDSSSPIVIRFDGARGVVEVEDGASGRMGERPAPGAGARLWKVLASASFVLHAAEKQKDKMPDWALVIAALLYMVGLRRFDESLEYFEHMKGIQFSIARDAGDKGNVYLDLAFAPLELREGFRALAAKQWEAERYALGVENLPVLGGVTRLLGFKSVEVVVDLQKSDQDGGSQTLTLGNLRFLFARSGGSRLSEQHLSYGQKRMLAFMYYQATGRSVVIADELVNGLHHSWIRACIEALEERQVFLTSQNPLLLDYLSFDSPEQVRSTFVLCRWEQGEGGGQMFWEDMSQDAAEDFFASYKVGFQQVGELLQSKGLW